VINFERIGGGRQLQATAAGKVSNYIK